MGRGCAPPGKVKYLLFEDYIKIALNANRVIGIYPEIKSPAYTNKYIKFPGGISFEQAVVKVLKKYKYGGKYGSEQWKKQPLFIQSFAPTTLVKTSRLIDSPLVFLVDDFTVLTQDTDEDWFTVTSTAYLKALNKKCNGRLAGLGPWKDTILVPDTDTNTFPRQYTVTFPKSGKRTFSNPNDLVLRAHRLGIQVHPYTFRNEARRLKWEYHTDPWNEYIKWNADIRLRVDGFFTDFCQTLSYVQRYYKPFKKGPAQ